MTYQTQHLDNLSLVSRLWSRRLFLQNKADLQNEPKFPHYPLKNKECRKNEAKMETATMKNETNPNSCLSTLDSQTLFEQTNPI